MLAVQLFGSYSRGEDVASSDCDIIVVADDSCADAWLRSIGIRRVTFSDEDMYWNGQAARSELFGTFFSWPDDTDESFFDPFVFPSGWRDELMLWSLQECGGHWDPYFMGNIARDAITYDPFAGSFPWRD